MSAIAPGPPEDFCFQLIGVSKTYRTADDTVQALRPADLTIPWNQNVAVLGYSGHGKSTLLHLLGLLDVADDTSGDLLYRRDERTTYSLLARSSDGVIPLTADQTPAVQRQDFGFVFQFQNLLSSLTCADNVGLGLRLLGVDRPAQRRFSAAAVESLGLGDKRHRKPRQLSGGEGQRIAVLRALAHGPRVVFADEPTANLDKTNARRVLDALVNWRQGGSEASPRTLFLATHDVGEAYRRCDCFLVLKYGAVCQGRVLRKHEDVRSAEQLAAMLEPDGQEADILPCLSAAPTAPQAGSGERAEAPPPEPPQPPMASWNGIRDGAASSGFLWELAARDLSDRWGPVVGSSVTLVLLVAMAVVGWGLLAGKEAVLRRELETPLARCLELDCSLRSDVTIDQQLLAKLYSLRLADGRFATESPPEKHVFPWIPMHLTFWEGNDQGPTKMVARRYRGRTVRRTDPLLGMLVDGGGREPPRFSSDDAREILVTRPFLERCGYPLQAGTIWVQHKDQQLSLRVVGVVDQIPGVGFDFLLPDGLYQQMVLPDFQPERHLDRVFLEEVPADFDLGAAQKALRPLLDASDLQFAMTPGRLEVRLPPGGVWPEPRLRSLAQEIDRRLSQAGLLPAGNRRIVLPEDSPSTRPGVPPDQSAPGRGPQWTHVTIEARSVEELPAVVAAAEPLGLSANRQYLYLLERLHRIIQPLRDILLAVVSVAALVAAINLMVTAFQRVQEKTYELGILKACGMTSRQLSGIFVRQGVLLGAAASTLGLTLGWGTGHVLSTALPGTAFVFHAWRALVVGGLGVCLSGVACWLGTKHATRLAAAVALRR